MNKLKLFKVIDLIDDDLIKEAEINKDQLSSADIDNKENITVSGVDVYHSSKWHRAALIAAVFLLMVGLGTGGTLIFRNSNKILPAEDRTLPSDISEINAASPLESTTDNKPQTAEIKKKETETKESTIINTTVTVIENQPTVTTDLDPMYAEIYKIKPNSDTVTSQASQTGVEDFVSRAQEFPVVTRADGRSDPIAAKPTDNTTSSEQTHYPSIAAETPFTIYEFQTSEIFEILRALSYSPVTCDGIPETRLTDSDGTVYQLNFSERWVWRNGIEEAYMPDEVFSAFAERGNTY